MTVFKSTDGLAIGQPISPFFGAQNGQQGAGAPTVQLPAGMPLLVAASLGLVPANALVNTINTVSAGGDPSKGGDPCTVAQIISNGNGAETGRGASTAPNGAINQQVFVDGIASTPAALATGPAPTDTSSLVECPVSGATLCQNVALFPQYGG